MQFCTIWASGSQHQWWGVCPEGWEWWRSVVYSINVGGISSLFFFCFGLYKNKERICWKWQDPLFTMRSCSTWCICNQWESRGVSNCLLLTIICPINSPLPQTVQLCSQYWNGGVRPTPLKIERTLVDLKKSEKMLITIIREKQTKIQWDTTSHLLRWLLSKRK